MHLHGLLIPFCWLSVLIATCHLASADDSRDEQEESSLEKLVKIFSLPGAFNRVDEILGGNSIDERSTVCPEGEEGLDCRRAEARRSVDCPDGDCYCHNCALAGPEMWPSCCRESSKCCSHLAAACRNCDHPTLIPFCSRHFKKCLSTTIERPIQNTN